MRVGRRVYQERATIAAVVVLMGCGLDTSSSSTLSHVGSARSDILDVPGMGTTSHAAGIPVHLPPTMRESVLIDSIVSLFPVADQPHLRTTLLNRHARIQIHGHQMAEQLLERLALERNVDNGGQSADPTTAVIALVDHLSDLSADAVVIRRKDIIPHDVITLADERASPNELKGALSALFAMRQRSGNVPTRNERAVVHASPAKRAWRRTAEEEQANLDLRSLRNASPVFVKGLGRVRAMEIPLKAVVERNVPMSSQMPR